MIHCIEISDATDAGVLAFDLVDVLELLPPSAERLRWVIDRLDARMRGNPPPATFRILAEAERARRVEVDWSQLRELAAVTLQTIDGRFAGIPRGERQLGRGPRNDTQGSALIVIEAVDSSYWRLTADDSSVLEPFRTAFERVAACGED